MSFPPLVPLQQLPIWVISSWQADRWITTLKFLSLAVVPLARWNAFHSWLKIFVCFYVEPQYSS